jgi:outer membrane protein OmpA-like peptidoglycan-associated protein
VVLLPNADGRASTLIVKTRTGETELSSPYAAVEVKDGAASTRTSSEGEIRSRYGTLLEANPPRPHSYVVHFFFNTTDFTPESKTSLEGIAAEISRLPVPEIVIVGHTDRTGPESINDPLSLRRAEKVRDALVAMGIRAKEIEVAGHGERELAVVTPAQVREPKNRRAEIRVR